MSQTLFTLIEVMKIMIIKNLLFLSLILLLTACQYFGEDLSGWITVSKPQPGTEVSCPLLVEGEARGNWYFEATFPVQLLNKDGAVLFSTFASAQGEWMTEDFVPFKLELFYDIDSSQTGLLLLKKDNPSGLPENDKQLEIPIQLNPCDTEVLKNYRQGVVENYIRLNIGNLSRIEPVLGGSWYVISVDFTNEDSVSVIYEDGHIQEHFEARFSVDEWGSVSLDFQ